MRIDLASESVELLVDRALLWRRRATLFIADPHFGKDATFREAGVPVPGAAMTHDLDRLGRLVAATACERLVILGDFFHAPTGRTALTDRALAAWFDRYRQLAVELVEGNHDRHAGPPPASWGMVLHHWPVVDGPFTYRHAPPERSGDGSHALCGHVHPAVRVRDIGGTGERLPCFHIAATATVLPAFGRFTGSKLVRPKPGDRLFAAVNDSVVAVPRCVGGSRHAG